MAKLQLGAMGADSDSMQMMYHVKMRPCTNPNRHEWKYCVNVHEGEEFARRDFTKQPYIAVLCAAAKEGRPCPQGDNCPFSHNTFEMWLHPSRFRTTMCRDGYSCTRHLCFFAHGPEQLRQPDHSCLPPHLQQLAKQHEDPPGSQASTKSRRSTSRSPIEARSPGGSHSPLTSPHLEQLSASMQMMQLNTAQQLMQQLQQLQQQHQQLSSSPPQHAFATFPSGHTSRPASEAAFPLSDPPAAPITSAPWSSAPLPDPHPHHHHHALAADGLALIHDPALAAMRSASPSGSDVSGHMYVAAGQQWGGGSGGGAPLHLSPQPPRQEQTEASFSWLVPSDHPVNASPSHLSGSFDLPMFVHGGGGGGGGALAATRARSPGPQDLPTADIILAASQPGSRNISPLRSEALPSPHHQQQQQQQQQWGKPVLSSSPPGGSVWAPQPAGAGFGGLLGGGFGGVSEPPRGGARSGSATPGSPTSASGGPPGPLQEFREYAAAASLSAGDAALVEQLVAARLEQAFAAGVAYAQKQAAKQAAQGQGLQVAQLQQLCDMLQDSSPVLGSLLGGQLGGVGPR